jgi:hypothetical protein
MRGVQEFEVRRYKNLWLVYQKVTRCFRNGALPWCQSPRTASMTSQRRPDHYLSGKSKPIPR